MSKASIWLSEEKKHAITQFLHVLFMRLLSFVSEMFFFFPAHYPDPEGEIENMWSALRKSGNISHFKLSGHFNPLGIIVHL